jgi:hypothetical protein
MVVTRGFGKKVPCQKKNVMPTLGLGRFKNDGTFPMVVRMIRVGGSMGQWP